MLLLGRGAVVAVVVSSSPSSSASSPRVLIPTFFSVTTSPLKEKVAHWHIHVALAVPNATHRPLSSQVSHQCSAGRVRLTKRRERRVSQEIDVIALSHALSCLQLTQRPHVADKRSSAAITDTEWPWLCKFTNKRPQFLCISEGPYPRTVLFLREHLYLSYMFNFHCVVFYVKLYIESFILDM